MAFLIWVLQLSLLLVEKCQVNAYRNGLTEKLGYQQGLVRTPVYQSYEKQTRSTPQQPILGQPQQPRVYQQQQQPRSHQHQPQQQGPLGYQQQPHSYQQPQQESLGYQQQPRGYQQQQESLGYQQQPRGYQQQQESLGYQQQLPSDELQQEPRGYRHLLQRLHEHFNDADPEHQHSVAEHCHRTCSLIGSLTRWLLGPICSLQEGHEEHKAQQLSP